MASNKKNAVSWDGLINFVMIKYMFCIEIKQFASNKANQ